MKIQSVPIADLSIDPSNARKHSQRNLDSIAASLKRFGQQKPIVIDKAFVVRAGNGTLLAAIHLGWDSINAVVTGLTGAEATAYAIADNRTAELAEWDDPILKATLEALADEDRALLDACGYTEDELAELLKDVELPDDAPITEDEVPEPPVDPITKPGDLWILGRHRLLCGDSTNPKDVARVMGGEKADCVLTDPPYGVGYSGQSESMFYGSNKTGKARTEIENDKTPEDARQVIVAALQIVPAPVAFVWCAPQYHDMAKAAIEAAGYALFSLIVWNKNHANFGAMGARYKPKFELALACKVDGIPWFGPDNEVTVWDVDRAAKNEFHPTQKPVDLFTRAIRNHTEKAAVIYDPFLGGGTTLIAAEQLNRKCYGMEISPQYCDVIVKRWENLTGEKAICQSAT